MRSYTAMESDMEAERASPTVVVALPDHQEASRVAEALRRIGLQVAVASDGEGAFAAMLACASCRCLVVDAALSSITTRELIERARSYLRFNRVPVILVADDDAPAGFSTKARFKRPLDVHDLVGAVVRYARASKSWPPMRAVNDL